jgi:hypothetical protein
MKNYIIIFFFLLCFQSVAQNQETRNLSSFTGIKAAEGIDVYLKKGNKHVAVIETSGTSTNQVITEVSGGYLKVHMKEGSYRARTVKVYVTYIELDKLVASSGANIFSEDIIKSGSMYISVSSGADIEAKVDCNEIKLEASSGGDILIEGKTKKASASASSGGSIDAYSLESESGYGRASSAGSVKLNVSNEIEANASSGGSIRYRGNPVKANTNSSSGGSVKKTN